MARAIQTDLMQKITFGLEESMAEYDKRLGNRPILTTGDVAVVMGVTQNHVAQLIQTGRIVATNISTGNNPQYRIQRRAVLEYLMQACTGC